MAGPRDFIWALGREGAYTKAEGADSLGVLKLIGYQLLHCRPSDGMA